MTAKEELKQYRFKKDKVNEALEEYEKYKLRAEKMTSVMSDTTARTNKTSDKVGDNAIMMAELSKKYEQRWINAENERLSILQSINVIQEPYRTILFMRYIEDMSLEAIAAKLNYSYSIIAHMHGDALQMYERRNNEI